MAELSKTQQAEVKKEVEKETQRLTEKILNKTNILRFEYKKQVSAAIIAAFGFLIALAWKDLIVKVMENLTKPALLEAYPYLADLYTALIVTGVSVMAIVFISNWANPKEDNK